MRAVFTRSLAITFAFVAGYCFPELNVLNWLIRWLIIGMLFLTFLGLRINRMKLDRRHLFMVLLNLAVGLGAFALLEAAGQGQLSQAAFFAGITPTATAAPVIIGFLNGNVEFVTTALLFDNAAMCALLPVTLPWVTGQGGVEVYWQVMQSVLIVMALPLAAALLVRRIYPGAFVWPRKLKDVSFGMWVAALVLIVAHASYDIRHNPEISHALLWQIGLVSLLLCGLNFALGYMIGGPDMRRECSQSLGQKNTTLTIVLAMTYANPIATLGPTFYVLWHNLWNAWQMYRTARKYMCPVSERPDDNAPSS